jgi:hypothetical protein
MPKSNFVPDILRQVFISIKFAPILFSMYTRCISEIVLEGSLKRGSINVVHLFAMAPSIKSAIIFM